MAKLPFEREVRKLMDKAFVLVYRPMDVRGIRFTYPKPADYLACDILGRFVIVECKATKGDRLPFSAIQDHQRIALSSVGKTKDGYAYLAINFRDAKAPGRAWMIPWIDWLNFESNWNKKSITREEMQMAFPAYEMERVTGGWRIHRPSRKLQIWREW